MMAGIKAINISKDFGRYRVFSDVTVEFAKGEIHGIIGRNGSGKTVLLKVISGFIPPDKGKVLYDNIEIYKGLDFPLKTGVIIESPGFLPNVSGFRNLQLLAAINNECELEDIENSMNAVGLDYDSKKSVSKYSLGMKQRLGIAQAIMGNPDYIILDEPFNGLDSTGVIDMRNLLMELRDKGKTIVLASHNTEDIKILCNTISKIENATLTRLE